MIEKVFSLPVPFHMLVVDDNSPDGTVLWSAEAQKTTGKLHLLERAGKNWGSGTAYS